MVCSFAFHDFIVFDRGFFPGMAFQAGLTGSGLVHGIDHLAFFFLKMTVIATFHMAAFTPQLFIRYARDGHESIFGFIPVAHPFSRVVQA
jgi:hypothetical protein